jgi:uncharacterized protein
MRNGASVGVVIPALNEERSIGRVVSTIPDWVDDIVVGDNGSRDMTATIAEEAGARVILEPRRGYGSACLSALATLTDIDVVVFLDGDFSDYPEEMSRLVDPIIRGDIDMVIGSRVLGKRESGALTPQAMFGNWLSCKLIRLFWNVEYSDLGPFRAISYKALKSIRMRDPDYGWTVEMQIKAARDGLRVTEVPVSYRRRIGKSKVSGTVRGVVGAGVKILWTIFLAAVGSALAPRPEELRERVVIFTRFPEVGTTKTRLIPALGPDGAADLQRGMTERALQRARELRKHRGINIHVSFEGGDQSLMSRWLGNDVRYVRQNRGDLGERMHKAFMDSFRSGMDSTVLVGTDCPDLSTEIISKAFALLRNNDIVLGPALDGGYYLIGLNRPCGPIMVGIPWGTDRVLSKTKEVAEEHGLSVAFVDTLRDVDRPEDLSFREEDAQEDARAPETTIVTEIKAKGDSELTVGHAIDSGRGIISVIVPALNEASFIEATLERVRNIDDVELIVVDGGSRDRTVDAARALGARVVHSDAGRARQMNSGANIAKGDILLFLHADTLLPLGWADHVRRAIDNPRIVAGAFELRLDEVLRGSRVIERLANFRSRRLRMPYGDQAIFIGADLFRTVGGFPELPIMEDFQFMRSLRKIGRIGILGIPAVTSARRWKTFGVVKNTLLNQLLITAYGVGVSPSFLAEINGRFRDRIDRVSP